MHSLNTLSEPHLLIHLGHVYIDHSIGSTRLVRRLCDLSSVGKFGRGGVEAEPRPNFPTEDKSHNLPCQPSRFGFYHSNAINLAIYLGNH